MIDYLGSFAAERGADLAIRVGIHVGSVTAGVIGKTKFAYDIWGDAVNIASRMESSGLPGEIHISGEAVDCLGDKSSCVPRGEMEIKGKGMMLT